jgi:hypothetical protein
MDVPYSTKLKIDELESLLQASLRPIVPSQDFVRQLKQRLAADVPGVHYPPRQRAHLFLLVFASLVSGVFLFLTGSRIILALIGSIGILLNLKRQA